ncbi:MAG: tetratricopeptide repeat protein, partial [Candidatus Bipolaricaulia bacterium]
VGKTRLASEFTGYARRTAGVSILQGFCQELEIKLAYQPLIEALRGGLAELAPEALGGTTPLWLAEVAKLVPELHEKIPDLPANPALPPEQERGRLFEGIVQFLVGLARQAPLIVLLDDLQWVDPSTCDLLHYLTPRLREQPILLLGTYRREEVDEEHPLTGLIRKSRGSFQLIELSRLSFEEVEGLLTDLAPSLNEPFRRRIYEETAGNPFFIVSILQNLFEEGALKVDERGRWVTDIDDITLNYRELMIPPGIREAIRRRLSVLAEDERRFLKLAAIIGRELDPALLKRAWGGEGQGEVELVERLLETNLIVEAEGRYEFSHPKISEVAYEETSGERRREWHRRVGEVIEELYAERLDEYYILLAHHYYHGEDWAKALEYTLLALKGAVKSHQLKEGLKLAELGLQSVERAGEEGAAESSLWEKRFDILAHRASIFDLLGESAKQEDDISTMLQLASRIPDLGRLLQAHQWRAEWYHAAGEYHQEIEEAERVLELTRRLKDRRGEGTALHTIGNAYNNLGEYHQALRYYERAYPILREVGARSGEGLALKNIGTIHHSQGRYSEALAYYEQALKIHQRVGYRVGEGIVLNNIGGIYASLGTYEQALEHCQAAYRIYREIGYHMGEEYALTNLATIYRGLGQSDRALECLEQARGMCQELGHRMVEAMVRHGLGLVALDEGRYQQAVGHFEEALQVLQELRTKELEVEALSWLGIAQLKLGDLAGALEGAGRAVKLLEAGQETEQPQAIYFNHFRVLSALDREEEAQTYLEKAYETLLERARRIGDRALEESFFEGVELHREILQEWESNR